MKKMSFVFGLITLASASSFASYSCMMNQKELDKAVHTIDTNNGVGSVYIYSKFQLKVKDNAILTLASKADSYDSEGRYGDRARAGLVMDWSQDKFSNHTDTEKTLFGMTQTKSSIEVSGNDFHGFAQVYEDYSMSSEEIQEDIQFNKATLQGQITYNSAAGQNAFKPVARLSGGPTIHFSCVANAESAPNVNASASVTLTSFETKVSSYCSNEIANKYKKTVQNLPLTSEQRESLISRFFAEKLGLTFIYEVSEPSALPFPPSKEEAKKEMCVTLSEAADYYSSEEEDWGILYSDEVFEITNWPEDLKQSRGIILEMLK